MSAANTKTCGSCRRSIKSISASGVTSTARPPKASSRTGHSSRLIAWFGRRQIAEQQHRFSGPGEAEANRAVVQHGDPCPHSCNSSGLVIAGNSSRPKDHGLASAVRSTDGFNTAASKTSTSWIEPSGWNRSGEMSPAPWLCLAGSDSAPLSERSPGAQSLCRRRRCNAGRACRTRTTSGSRCPGV